MSEQIILVDENDQQIGLADKLQGHKDGALHRGFSIFVFNNKNQLMLQQRAKSKYHCGGMWTNTTCSHPRPGEDIFEAAHRRLQEEMGFDTDLKKVTEFVYKVPFDNGLTEHEYLHVFIGRYNNAPKLNPEEADDWKWISLNELEQGIETNQEIYTFWMQKALPAVKEALKEL